MSKSIQWRTNWQEACDQAKKDNLPLALEFFMEGCPACGRLVRVTCPPKNSPHVKLE